MKTLPAVRKATIEDFETVLRLAKELFIEIGHQLSNNDYHKSVLFFKNILEKDEYVVFLSVDSEGVANGVITLSEGLSIYAGGRFGVIREFYVVPEMRSRGVGKMLLEKAKESARNKGWKRIEVTPPAKEKWIRTYNFYSREGFREIGPRLKFENL